MTFLTRLLALKKVICTIKVRSRSCLHQCAEVRAPGDQEIFRISNSCFDIIHPNTLGHAEDSEATDRATAWTDYVGSTFVPTSLTSIDMAGYTTLPGKADFSCDDNNIIALAPSHDYCPEALSPASRLSRLPSLRKQFGDSVQCRKATVRLAVRAVPTQTSMDTGFFP